MIAAAIVVGFILAVAVHWMVGLAVAVGGTAFAVHASNKKKEEAKAMCSPQCTGPECAVSYLGWSGTIETFDIASEKYALAFMLSNRQKLINVTAEQWAKLDAVVQAATIATMQPLSPASVAPSTSRRATAPPAPRPGDALLKWIEKVESARGPAARRAAVELALSDPDLADQREQFVKTAAQVEMRATLDKVDTLKTPAAKRRHLTDALAALRVDSAADELQQAEIEALERAIRELEESRS